MKINRFLALALIVVLAIATMSLFSIRASARTSNQDDGVGDAGEDAGEGPHVPIRGDALEQASAAALEYVGEGRVTDTEVGDEEGYYEIEVTLDDGSQVDVHLDENFNVLSQVSDEEEAGDD
jgi:hypothetical protein